MKKYLLLLLLTFPAVSFGQTLVELQRWAREAHPFLVQKELYDNISRQRQANTNSNNLPSVLLNAQATYQSDVTSVNIPSIPGVSGLQIPSQSKDQYKAWVDVRQNIWDGGMVKVANALESAQNAVNVQGVEVELYKVREQVNQLFFSSFLLQENLNILERKEETLQEKEKQMESAVKNGVLLASELDVLRAELLQLKQQRVELQSSFEVCIASLAILTGKSVSEIGRLSIDSTVDSSKSARPEIELFGKQESLLTAKIDMLKKERNPVLFGFGQAGYGRPGLNMLQDDFDPYYMVGVGLKWNVLDWKNLKRNKDIVKMEKQLVQSQQNAFERGVEIALEAENRKIEQITEILKTDAEHIQLRETITKSAASQHENGAMTTSDYLKELNAEMTANIMMKTHQVQLELAKANCRFIIGEP